MSPGQRADCAAIFTRLNGNGVYMEIYGKAYDRSTHIYMQTDKIVVHRVSVGLAQARYNKLAPYMVLPHPVQSVPSIQHSTLTSDINKTQLGETPTL